MAFARASRKGTFVLIGMTGMSGTGKTFSAIKLARGLVGPKGKIGLLDTEQGRGSMYSDLTDYLVDDLHPPFSPQRYTEKIREAVKEKLDVLIIDSGSHEWESLGGILEMAEATGKQGLQKWLGPKTAHKKFVNELLQAPFHVILCLRGKEKMVQAKDERGKEIIVSQGTVPIQEKRLLYEMTVSVVFDENDPKGVPTLKKCPESLLSAFPKDAKGKHIPISEKSGEVIREWVGGAIQVDHALATLKTVARDAAAEGSEVLKVFFASLDQPKKASLAGIGADLESAAKDADRLAAMGDSAEGPSDDGAPPTDEEMLTDSFMQATTRAQLEMVHKAMLEKWPNLSVTARARLQALKNQRKIEVKE